MRFKTVMNNAALPPALRRRITPLCEIEAVADYGNNPDYDDFGRDGDQWVMEVKMFTESSVAGFPGRTCP